MFGFFTRDKKGFTLVELLVVVLLLGLGAFAMMNVINVGYRAFDKSEERYIKQEAVKLTAELLRSGSANVAAAQSADIFADPRIVPAGEVVDEGYSYLFTQAVRECKTCGEAYPFTQSKCGVKDENGVACNGTGDFAGYFLYNQNKGQKRSEAKRISDVPMFIDIKVYQAPSHDGGPLENQCGVTITIASLEDDFISEVKEKGLYDENGVLTTEVISDNIYYSLDVTYHFPNMVTSDTGVVVNYTNATQRSQANVYDQKTGALLKEGSEANSNYETVSSVDTDGEALRIYADSIISGDNTNTSVAIPKLCFIATASYGYDSGEVGLLCDFRDNVLLKSELGTAFVNAYYKLSPPVADFISEHEGLKAAVRIALKPVIVVAEYALEPELLEESAPWMIVFLGCLAGTVATVVVIKKRKNRIKE